MKSTSGCHDKFSRPLLNLAHLSLINHFPFEAWAVGRLLDSSSSLHACRHGAPSATRGPSARCPRADQCEPGAVGLCRALQTPGRLSGTVRVKDACVAPSRSGAHAGLQPSFPVLGAVGSVQAAASQQRPPQGRGGPGSRGCNEWAARGG